MSLSDAAQAVAGEGKEHSNLETETPGSMQKSPPLPTWMFIPICALKGSEKFKHSCLLITLLAINQCSY